MQALTRARAAALALRYDEAAGICQDVLAVAPDDPNALASLGIIVGRAGEAERGIALLRRAIALYPENASWHANLGAHYRATHRTDEALAAGRQAARLEPESPDHLVALALTLVEKQDPGQAAACLLRAIGLTRDDVNAHLLLAEILLAGGDFAAGWREYEWRMLTDAGKRMMPALRSAYWNGMRLPGERLLLFGDQGYGDMIHFSRYIPMAAERCQEIVLVCVEEMKSLLQHVPGVRQARHRWDDLPAHAAHCRLASLPLLFNTTPETIPATAPYLAPDPARVAHWRDRLAASLPAGAKRVGLAWRGRATHPNDRSRSMPLSCLTPLANAGGVAFVSVQRPMTAADLDSAARFPGMADLTSELTDFAETAAVVQNLDVVITVDTAVAHLAGALGRPVWIMLSSSPDWRWQLHRDASPWYPTARLFRQDTPGAWDAVVSRVRDALADIP